MASYKILVIEDEATIRMMYEFKLRVANFDIATASNGLEGLTVAKAYSPDLILLDLHMPIMDGEAMMHKLRSTEWGASIRVVILTNTSKHEAPSALRFLSVDRYIVKSHTTPADIVRTIQDILK